MFTFSIALKKLRFIFTDWTARFFTTPSSNILPSSPLTHAAPRKIWVWFLGRHTSLAPQYNVELSDTSRRGGNDACCSLWMPLVPNPLFKFPQLWLVGRWLRNIVLPLNVCVPLKHIYRVHYRCVQYYEIWSENVVHEDNE